MYGADFAAVYDQHFSSFGRGLGAQIRAYYESMQPNVEKNKVLDLACGTGAVALDFALAGYDVVGIDVSPHMIDIAKRKSGSLSATGRAIFECGDMREFKSSNGFSLALSTGDAINHLSSELMLRELFTSVARALQQNGVFIFDVNTELGLRRMNGDYIRDYDDSFIVWRSLYDDSTHRSNGVVSGFVREEGRDWKRFRQSFSNTAYPVSTIRDVLAETGFSGIHFARLTDFARLTEFGIIDSESSAEKNDRIFVIAHVTPCAAPTD